MHSTSRVTLTLLIAAITMTVTDAQESFSVRLRYQRQEPAESGTFVTKQRTESWQPAETAIIVCDAWDLHHCLNAVRRLKQFAPRLNEVLVAARDKGVTIIHAPSDCMEAYQQHPSRRRATQIPKADYLPDDIESWCSVIPAEENAVYPIDQSDGGEDDDPEEHARWVEELKSMGRNPATPWKRQIDVIEIDEDADFISDQGDEVWNILQQRGIRNVILAGVHTNMCVLGRPFGLRQMARNGKNVVLMRDMTDTMYNPKRWPYVSHFEGTRRIVSHIERYVCPTITSDQLIGGNPFRFQGDDGPEDVGVRVEPSSDQSSVTPSSFRDHWTAIDVPHRIDQTLSVEGKESLWYRSVVRVPQRWIGSDLRLILTERAAPADGWLNGKPLESYSTGDRWALLIASDAVVADDANLLVLRLPAGKDAAALNDAPVLVSGDQSWSLDGRWQFRIGDDATYSTMPLPAKFGGSADIVFTPEDPLWVPRPVTASGEFTDGIEGPACDRQGRIYAVNFAHQGTIGRVSPDGTGEVFVQLPEGSIGNGIRFASDASFFVADYTGHNVLRVDLQTRDVRVHAHDGRMNQPNDLAIAPDGKTLYASDPNWAEGTGQLWRIDADGTTDRLADGMGTTNGIEVSPDGNTLYVNESKQRNVWAFGLTADRQLANKRLVRRFEDFGFDGMRCDVDGNLYITRHGKGTVIKMTPAGDILREIPVLGSRPSNLCFGGPDGCTLYVTEVDSQRLVRFRVDRPGRSWRQ